MKYFTNASGSLASDASGVANRYTAAPGWVVADDLNARSLPGVDWWRVSASEAVELQRVIDRLPRPV